MILLNFSHPLTPEQIAQVEDLSGMRVEQVLELPVQFDNQQPFLPQFQELIQKVPLEAQQWQQLPLVVNPPSLNYISALVLAELHGRMGFFPPVLRLRPIADSLPPRYEAAEILNLQAVRDQARHARF